MRIHWLQHVPFEGLGAIEGWLLRRGHTLSCTRFHAGEMCPSASDPFDWLIVMGGPMNIYQHRDHPWLPAEKGLIADSVAKGKRILGICLGSQLIADVLGGKVFQNQEKEIGWFPVRAVDEGVVSPFALPKETRVFHWHGDTFTLPPKSVWLAESSGCAHQAFALGSRVLGLQFHLELGAPEIGGLVRECAEDLKGGLYVQGPKELISVPADGGAARLLDRLLGVLEAG